MSDSAHWLTYGGIAAAFAAGGTAVAAWINRRPTIEAAVNVRVSAVFAAYEQTIRDLRMEIAALKDEVHKLNEELASHRNGFGA